MAELQVQRGGADGLHNISGRTVLYAIIAGLVISGPLLGMMGFALLATTTLALLAALPMLLFSPIIVPAGLVLAGSMVAFGVAVGMAFVGLSALTWAFRSVGGALPGGLSRVKEGEMEFGGYLQQKAQAYEPRTWQNRATT